MTTALTPIARAAVALGTAEREKVLIALAQESTELVKITNQAGRDQIHAARMKLKTTRVDLEKSGKAARDDAQAYSKAVIAEEKRLIGIIAPEEDRLQVIQSEYDDRQERERQAKADALRKRIEELQNRITELKNIPQHRIGQSAELLRVDSEELQARDLSDFADLQGDAEAARSESLKTLSGMYLEAKSREEEAARQVAEAERLKAEREQFEREKAAERERVATQEREAAAVRAAEQKRLDDAAAEVRRQQAEVDAQRRAQEDQQRAIAQAEEDRQRAERQKAEDEAAALRRAAEEAAAQRAKNEREAAERAIADERARAAKELEAKAKAQDRLAAAAPALLAALKLFKEQYDACGPNSEFGRHFKNVYHPAREAIALATEEQTEEVAA